ncbi:protein DBF4 homolog B isoform X2 [Pelodiscus sinensis]|uniref:protein DBF4 homolog B isoform X2 n=1 Tax=Pelodiscus sinensis TaxID=13735 RepID=UPI003F6ADD14
MGCHAEKGRRRPPDRQQRRDVVGPSGNLPFLGKSFYLDLPSNKPTQFLVATIKQLGGVIESFLSKEVSYVVSSSKEAKLDCVPGKQTETRSSAASGDAKAKTLPSSVPKGSRGGPHHKPADSALISRGKELLQKAMRNQDSSSGSSILASARSWGVQILHVDDMMAYVQQLLFRTTRARKKSEKMTVKCFSVGPGVLKVRKLKPPFLKIEDQSRRFRPFHHQFESFPDLNFLAPSRSSPFEPLKSPSSSCRLRAPEACQPLSTREGSPRSGPAAVPKRRRGYCECCQEAFGELQTHLQSPRHRRFAQDASQYAAVDHVISQLRHDFAELPGCALPPRAPCSPTAGARAQALPPRGAPAPELGPRHRAAREAEAEQQCSAAARLGGECSVPREKAGQLPVAEESLAGRPLLGLWAEQTLRPRLAERVPAWAAVNSTVGAAAPDPSPWTCASRSLSGEATTCSPEPAPWDALEPPGASPCPRKRKRSASLHPQLAKRPRLRQSSDPLCLEKQAGLAHSGSVQQGGGLAAGGAAGTTPSLMLGAELCGFPASVTPQDRGHVVPEPPEPAPMALADALASPAVQRGWDRGTPGLQEGQPTEKAPAPPCCAPGWSHELQSPAWDKASCPAGHPALPHLPKPQARPGGASPCVHRAGVAEGVQCEPPITTALGESLDALPSTSQPAPGSSYAGPAPRPSPSSSESDWDLQLLGSPDALWGPGPRAVDLEVLRRTCTSIRDSGYEAHLYAVLRPEAELEPAGREERSRWTCGAEAEGAPLTVLEACLGSWPS